MKVYLAGKITGDPNYREKFAAAAKKLEERAGVTVISPAVTPEGLKKADYMRICFAMLESGAALPVEARPVSGGAGENFRCGRGAAMGWYTSSKLRDKP